MIALQDRTDTHRWLHTAAIVFAVAVLVHNGDHLRRGGDSVSTEVFWAGSSAMILEVGVVAMVLMRHRLAAAAAVTVGFALALGYISVHFTPQRSFFNDSLISGGASPISIAAASFEAAGALALGVTGWLALRASGLHDDAPALSWSEVLRHPVVAVLIIGNVLILLGSLATR
jgi:hypothetical protein